MLNEYDLLLHWLSSRPLGAASALAITEACVTLAQRTDLWRPDAPQSHWRFRFLGTLHRLGHVEPAGRNKWAVIPPTVLWTAGKSQVGEVHVYGARSTTLWRQLYQTFGDQLQSIPQLNGPALWQFTGTRGEATDLVHALGIEMHEERGEVMLALLPSLAEAIQHLKKGMLPNPGERWKLSLLQKYMWHAAYRSETT